jgi:hypothetical protein
VFDSPSGRFQFPRSNRYVMVNIPLLVGFETSLKKFDVYGMAGLSLNVAVSARGNILAPNSDYLLVLENESSTPIKRRAGLSAHASAGMAYRMLPNMSFLVEPGWRIGLGSMTKGEYPLSQRYSAFSLGAGIKLDF